jgi:nicotinate-nucleotide pyrophosphorylase (carboxylating)
MKRPRPRSDWGASPIPRRPSVRFLQALLAEDRVGRDRTTRALVPIGARARAEVIAQGRGIVSGVAVATALAEGAGLTVRSARIRDGDPVRPGRVVLRISGTARAILGVERTLLNLLMHLSGVATATDGARRAARRGRRSLAIYGTRKTIPGLRDLEKAAIRHGGGFPHRRDLSDGILIKTNHLALVPLDEAVRRVRRRVGPAVRVQVEVRSASGALRAVRAGADALLIDNASPAAARRIVTSLQRAGRREGVWIEVSGGITPRNVGSYVMSGADAASLGSLTHSAVALPFHLVMRRPLRSRSA